MLGVGLFAAFWAVLGLIVFFIAARGGLGGARATFQSQTRSGRASMGVIFAIVYVGFGVALPVVFFKSAESPMAVLLSPVVLL